MKSLEVFLEKAYDERLNLTEAVEQEDKLVKFVELLIEIDQKQRSKESENN